LVPVGCVSNVNALTRILDCRVSSLPLKYLSLTPGAPFKNLFGKQVLRRLAEWKRLSFKEWLINVDQEHAFQLAYIFFSFFPIPVGVANRIEKIAKGFLMRRLE
jgi:hypothetical protein